jgi:pSer/pThr/pTyr-binding forkhead associated (FHA) protein
VHRFRLRYQHHDLEIPPGEFVVGRSRECQLALEDPLISRRHAAFIASAERLEVEDLGSRNGVRVNQQRIHARTELNPGDVVSIGSQELVVHVSERAETSMRRPAVTMTHEAAQPGQALSLLAGVVDKALAMGRIDEAERILTNVLADTLAGVQSGRRDGATLADATRYAMRLASETGKGSWIDWVFNAHHAAARVLPAPTVDELYSLARRIRYPVTPALRTYVGGLRARADRLSPTERFALQRIEGLVRVLLA